MLSQPINNRHIIDDGLNALATALSPFVANKTGVAAPTDLSALLREMLSRWDDAFHSHLGHRGKNLVYEIRDIRNDWAHYNKPFDDDDTDRALDSIERLLTSIDATKQAALVNWLKDERRRARYGSPVQPPPATEYPMATPAEPLQPIVRRLMSVLLEDHPTLLDDADVLNLLNSDYCQNELRLQISGFALLRTEREGRSVSGHSRYWAKLYAGRYYVCSQWWKDYHRHNAGSLLRFVTKFVQGNPGHPGIPVLVEIEKRLTDYIAQSAA